MKQPPSTSTQEKWGSATWGTTSSRATFKQQLRRHATPVLMEACTAPVTKPDCHSRLYVTISTRQPGTDHVALFIPVHKVKNHLIS